MGGICSGFVAEIEISFPEIISNAIPFDRLKIRALKTIDMLMNSRFAVVCKRLMPCIIMLVMVSFLNSVNIIHAQSPRSVKSSRAVEVPRRRIASFDSMAELDDDQEAEVSETEEASKKQNRVRQASELRERQWEEEELDTTPVSENGLGAMGRLSHLAGKTFGRNDSITPLEVMPYMLADEHFVFADVRGFVSNRSQVGGNFGVGYRRLFDAQNAWAGASLWYDADQTTAKLYQQIGLSFEGLVNQFEFRSNVYLPFSNSQTVSNTIGNPTIVGNQLLYSWINTSGTALRGVDAEVGYSWPVLDRHVVRGFVGGYHFEGGASSGVNGVKARVEGVINNTVTAQLLYTHDNLYGDNLMVGVSLQYPFSSNHPSSSWSRTTPSPFRYVERNYNVIIEQSQAAAGTFVATDPTTSKAYVVEQVYAPASGAVSAAPDGTTANPFSTVAAAQAAGGNVILVQSGSVLNQPVTLAPGQRLFGMGNYAETLTTTNGNLSISNVLQSGTNAAPIIQNATGDALTLASNTEIAGFNLSGATGNTITGNSVTGVSLHDLSIISNAGNAISLSNSSNVSLFNTQVTSTSSQPAISLLNNPGPITINSVSINSQNGTGLYASNVTGLQITGGTIATTNATGLDIESSSVNANLNSVSVNGGAYGIQLVNSTGNFTISGNGSSGSGGTIQNTTASGVLINSFGSTNLNWVNFSNNPIGIQSTGSTQLNLTSLTMSGSSYAIVSTNDASLQLVNSTLHGNGSLGDGTVLIQANAVGTFTSVITGNTITDTNGTAVQFLTQAGGIGSTLNTQIASNMISGYNPNFSILGINWSGPVTASISSNTLNAYGANMTAVNVQDSSTTSPLAATITNNSIYFQKPSAVGGTGIWVVDGQPGQTSAVTSTLTESKNLVQFQQNNGTGLQFGLYGATTATITTNTVSDLAGGATGMQFDSVAANSTLTINSNLVSLVSSDPTTHRGIVFSQVGSNVTFATLTNTISNTISNASPGQAFLIPSGTGTGGILINGNLILLPE